MLDVLFRPALDITADEQSVKLRWVGKVGRSYQVFTTSEPHGPWTAGPVFKGEGTETAYTEPPPGCGKRFYKVVVR